MTGGKGVGAKEREHNDLAREDEPISKDKAAALIAWSRGDMVLHIPNVMTKERACSYGFGYSQIRASSKKYKQW